MTEAVRVEVRLFGRYRELAEKPVLAIDLPADRTVADLVEALHRAGAGPLPARPVVAVNHRPAGDERVIEPGDEVALIPPVAGG